MLAAFENRESLVADADLALADAQAALDAATAARTALIYARFPGIDDPWRGDFESTLATHAATLAALLGQQPERNAWLAATSIHAAAERLADRALVARALSERLLRTVETLTAAARVRSADPAAFAKYLRLRDCERFVPLLR